MVDDSVLIEDFIRQTVAKIKLGMGTEYAFDGPIEFELSVGVSKTVDGRFNLKVFGIGGDVGTASDDEIIQSVAFAIRPKDDLSHQFEQQFMTIANSWLASNKDRIIEELNKPSPKPKKLPGKK